MTDEIGALKAYVTLLEPIRTPDGMGGAALSWTPAGAVWADWEALSGALTGELDGAVARASYRLTVRAPCVAQPGWRIEYSGRTLRVEAAAPRGARIVLNCIEEIL